MTTQTEEGVFETPNPNILQLTANSNPLIATVGDLPIEITGSLADKQQRQVQAVVDSGIGSPYIVEAVCRIITEQGSELANAAGAGKNGYESNPNDEHKPINPYDEARRYLLGEWTDISANMNMQGRAILLAALVSIADEIKEAKRIIGVLKANGHPNIPADKTPKIIQSVRSALSEDSNGGGYKIRLSTPEQRGFLSIFNAIIAENS